MNANRIALWNGTTWQALGNGANNTVYAITINSDGTMIYAGGIFSQVGSTQVNYIATWNSYTFTWLALGNGLSNGRGVYAIDIDQNGNVYAGGDFTDSVSLNNIAMWDGTTWQALGSGTGSGIGGDNTVNAIAIISNTVYVGGNFTVVNGSTSAKYIAIWTGTSWTPVGSGTGGGFNNFVKAIKISNTNNIYIGGLFTQSTSGTQLNGISKVINYLQIGPLDSGVTGGQVNTITTDSSGNVYAGGNFTNASGIPVNGFAEYFV